MSEEKRISRRQLLCQVAAMSAGLALAGPMLAACGPTPAPTATPKAEVKVATPAPVEKPAATPVPVVKVTPAAKVPVQLIALERLGDTSKILEEHAKAFEAKNPNIKVKVQAYPGAEYWQKIEVRAAAETLGDTLFNSLTHDWFGMCDRGLMLELDPYLKAEGADLKKEFYPRFVEEAMMYKGKTYGISEFSHPGSVGIYINQELFDKAGIKYPDWDITFEKTLENSIKLTEDTNKDGKTDQWGWMMPPSYEQWFVYFYTFGGHWFNEQENKVILDSPGNMQALQWVYDIGYKHKAAVTQELIQESTTFMFASAKVAVMHGIYGTKQSIDAAVKDKFKWMATPFPYNPGTDKKDHRLVYAHTGPQGIYVSTKHPEEAYKWLRYLTGFEAAMVRANAQMTLSPRPDVWEHPELLKLQHHQMFKKFYDSANLHILRPPTNLRVLEQLDALQAALAPIALGKQTPQQAIGEIKAKVQAVMDKPKP